MILPIIARFRRFSEYYAAAPGVALLLTSSQALPDRVGLCRRNIQVHAPRFIDDGRERLS
ncbi:hypothetical protein A4G28_19285 [Mycobacterium ostraviense]|uniref:Uncharacterized protein n=1 Tax=Mycobacterium ostraviense TaxID=2738409 RepID=A0A163WXB6_9MYCO|nr:hypothetical protein A4G28_19285 [Mycobacterium ostraviense]